MARIVIVGSGTVGQATGKGLIKKGHEVVFVDINTKIVRRLCREGLQAYLPSELGGIVAEISMFCVSTPPKDDGAVNLDYIVSATTNFGKWLKHTHTHRERERGYWHLVVIRSTVPPGTTRKILLPLLEKSSGLTASKDFGLCMQPEFLRAKSSEGDFLHPWATVIGELDQRSGDMLAEVYTDFGNKIFRVDLETAEFIKYVHNCFNATKISFTNEIWEVGKKLSIDGNFVMEIVAQSAEGMWNPKYGIKGGYPYSGDCLPKDTKAFLTFAAENGIQMPLLSAVIKVNEKMKERR